MMKKLMRSNEEELYIEQILKAAHGYLQALDESAGTNKAIEDTGEYKSWQQMIKHMSPLFIIDMCNAWRELQQVKSLEAIRNKHRHK